MSFAAIIDYLFGAASFMPHGVCLAWRPDLVASTPRARSGP